jgi:acetoacetyl-CoA synthetase
MCEAMGFSYIDRNKIILPPLLNLITLRGPSPRIISDPEQVRALLDGEQRRIFDDHAPYDCLQLVLQSGSKSAYLVVKRRTMRRLPVSDLLYCSAPSLLAQHLERVKLAVIRLQRSAALTAEAGIFGALRPLGAVIRRPKLFRSSVFHAHELDKLYSELILLPVYTMPFRKRPAHTVLTRCLRSSHLCSVILRKTGPNRTRERIASMP